MFADVVKQFQGRLQENIVPQMCLIQSLKTKVAAIFANKATYLALVICLSG